MKASTHSNSEKRQYESGMDIILMIHPPPCPPFPGLEDSRLGQRGEIALGTWASSRRVKTKDAFSTQTEGHTSPSHTARCEYRASRADGPDLTLPSDGPANPRWRAVSSLPALLLPCFCCMKAC